MELDDADIRCVTITVLYLLLSRSNCLQEIINTNIHLNMLALCIYKVYIMHTPCIYCVRISRGGKVACCLSLM